MTRLARRVVVPCVVLGAVSALLVSSSSALAAPPEAPETKPATAVTATTASVHGVLDPQAASPELVVEYDFFYAPGGVACTPGLAAPETPGVASGLAGEEVEAGLTGLEPGAEYAVCVAARNPGETEWTLSPVPVTFRALAVPPAIIEQNATQVTATSARLAAQLDPGGAGTTYHFEYGTSTSYGQSTPESPPLAADNSNHPAAAAIQGLHPATTYHYRAVASNGVKTVTGPDQIFTTRPVSEAFALPDGREYEQVSPTEKGGAEILGLIATTEAGRAPGAPGGSAATQASEDGTAVTYVASAAIGPNPAGSEFATQVLSRRGAGGWSSQDIANPHTNKGTFSYDHGEEYRLFSSDLSRALVQSPIRIAEPALAPEIHEEIPPQLEINIRDNATGVVKALLSKPAESPPNIEGASPDFSHVVFTAGPENAANLYVWFGGQPQLLNVLPNGEVAGGSVLGAGARNGFGLPITASVGMHPISNDGTRVVWSAGAGVFTRDVASEERSIEVDLPQGGAGVGGGIFQAASSDGSRIIFTGADELTPGAHAGDVYQYDLNKPIGERLTDLTPQSSGGDISVIAADEHATSLYLVSGVVLTNTANGLGEKATEGASNVYALREAPVGSGSWSTTFVATLSQTDTEGYFKDAIAAPPGHGARAIDTSVRVSPNGRYLAFMSNRSLTGYDNLDANSGQPDEEVYLYDAEAGKLACASCDPTGARPVGILDPGYRNEGKPLSMDASFTWQGDWVAALIPGGNAVQPVYRPFLVTSLYQSRIVSDSGRLFFNSVDALVAQDVNGKADVYQYEPGGVGSCSEVSACVGLISSGKSSDESVFFDASGSGNDVFFTTTDRLVSQDRDNSTDIYDARVCVGSEPCPPPPEASPPPCSTADGCRAAQTPQPGVFGVPASSTFVGAGNRAPEPTTSSKPKPTHATCKRGFVRRFLKKHAKCVKNKKAKKSANANRRVE